MSAIFKREFKAYFTSPVGYVILAAFVLFSGLSFSSLYAAGSAEVYYVFSNLFLIVLCAVPILTMRLMSEDKRLKTDQALLTSPVKLGAIVGGKFLAALAVLAISLSITIVYQLIVSFYVAADWMVFISNLLGILLLGAALIAIGLFISSLTESQVVAAIGSLAVSLFLFMMDSLSQFVTAAWFTKFITWVSFYSRYQAFVNGILDYSNMVYFLSITVVFLFFSVRVLEKRRWA